MDAEMKGLLERLHGYRLGGRSMPQQPLHGWHRTQQEGAGVDISSMSPYYPGDDLRYLDWRIYARDRRLVLRRHETERQRQCMFLLDGSRSMAVAEKKEMGERLAVSLAWVAALSGCQVRFGVLGRSDHNETVLFGPERGSGVHPQQFVSDLKLLLSSDEVAPSSKVHPVYDVSGVSDPVAASMAAFARQGLICDQAVLISDLFEHSWQEMLRSFASTTKDAIVLILQSEADRAPTGEGAWSLLDVETGGTRQADLTPARLLAYRRRWQEWQTQVNEMCRRLGIDAHLLPAEAGLSALLLHHLPKRGLLVPAYAT